MWRENWREEEKWIKKANVQGTKRAGDKDKKGKEFKVFWGVSLLGSFFLVF